MKSLSAAIVMLTGMICMLGVGLGNRLGLFIGLVLFLTGLSRWSRSWGEPR